MIETTDIVPSGDYFLDEFKFYEDDEMIIWVFTPKNQPIIKDLEEYRKMLLSIFENVEVDWDSETELTTYTAYKKRNVQNLLAAK